MVPIPTRFPERMKAALDQAAEANDRTRAHQIRRYVREGLKRDGFLPSGGANGGES